MFPTRLAELLGELSLLAGSAASHPDLKVADGGTSAWTLFAATPKEKAAVLCRSLFMAATDERPSTTPAGKFARFVSSVWELATGEVGESMDRIIRTALEKGRPLDGPRQNLELAAAHFDDWGETGIGGGHQTLLANPFN